MAVAREIGGQESGQTRLGPVDAGQPRAKRDDIGVFMLARKLRRQALGHKRAAAGRVAIDRNRNADAGLAQRDAALCAALRALSGQHTTLIGKTTTSRTR